MDGIMPIMLQQGFGLLAGKFMMLLRASLALGYIPMNWRQPGWFSYQNLGKQ
jgi:hypothetical protein